MPGLSEPRITRMTRAGSGGKGNANQRQAFPGARCRDTACRVHGPIVGPSPVAARPTNRSGLVFEYNLHGYPPDRRGHEPSATASILSDRPGHRQSRCGGREGPIAFKARNLRLLNDGLLGLSHSISHPPKMTSTWQTSPNSIPILGNNSTISFIYPSALRFVLISPKTMKEFARTMAYGKL